MTTPLPPALVLTAGYGTRLAPLTDVRAKPAVPVAGVPLIVRQLRWLATQGVHAAVLNLHHRPHSITRVVGSGTDVGMTVRYSWEPTVLGTAGGPRHALPLLPPRFFIVNGDTLTDVDLVGLLRAHDTHDADATLAVTPNPAPDRYGGAIVDERGYITDFVAPGPRARALFVGVQIVEAAVFAGLTDGEPAASIGGIYNHLLRTAPPRLRAHEVITPFYDVGTAADYLATSLAFGKAEGRSSLPSGDRCRIDPGATVVRTAVWDDVVIERGCRLTDCIVADDVHVPPNVVAERKILMRADGQPRPGSERHGDLRISPLEGRLDTGRPEDR